MKYSKDIDKLIDAAIADGELDQKKINSLRKKADADGLNPDEVELNARGRLSIMKQKKDKKETKFLLIMLLSFAIIPIAIVSISDYYSDLHNKESNCIEKVAKCISKNKLEKAEYYIKSYKHAGTEYLDLPSTVIENLVQAYIDNGEVNKAVSLSKWSWQYVGKPVYEYYMLNNEYLLAEEFLEPGVENYSEHLKRVVTNLVLRDEAEKAKKYVVAKSQYFDSVKDKAYKQTVINNLMAIINAE